MNGLQVINLNGTDGQVLVDGYADAATAVDGAMKKLKEVHPHGRDYQTAPKGEYEIGLARFAERYRILDSLRRELIAEAIALNDQLTGRSGS